MAEKVVDKNCKVRMYGDRAVRTVFDPKKNKVFFCVKDVIGAVTNAADVKDYLKKMRKRDEDLAKSWERIVRFLPYRGEFGLLRLNFADFEGVSKIIKTITPERAEPFKKWMAKLQKKAGEK